MNSFRRIGEVLEESFKTCVVSNIIAGKQDTSVSKRRKVINNDECSETIPIFKGRIGLAGTGIREITGFGGNKINLCRKEKTRLFIRSKPHFSNTESWSEKF